MWLLADHTFHGVGQGLFYSLTLTVRSSMGASHPFSFVYDCGSDSGKEILLRRVEEYRHLSLIKKRLNLLVLSHFDRDHINGVEQLIRHVHVDTVMIPYLTPVERLYLIAMSNRPSAEYLRFLAEPATFLREKCGQGTRIVYLTSAESGPSPLPGSDEVAFANPHPAEIDWRIWSNEQAAAAISDLPESARGDPDLGACEIQTDSLPVTVGPRLWTIHMHVRPIGAKQLDALEQAARLAGVLLKPSEVARDKKDRAKLKKAYLLAFGKGHINGTSLCCLHGPAGSWGLEPPVVRGGSVGVLLADGTGRLAFVPGRPHQERVRYTFLSGDAELKVDWVAALRTRFAALWPFVDLFQVPHHGSAKNWTQEIRSDCLHADYVVSAGIGNKHSHPSPETMEDITAGTGKAPMWAHQYNPVLKRGFFLLPTPGRNSLTP